jgi:hypothetical protein
MGFEEDIKPTAPMQKLKMSGASVTEGRFYRFFRR